MVYGINSMLLDVLLPYKVRMFYAIFGIPGLNIFFGQGGSILRIDIDWQIIELDNKSMFHPIDN